MLGHGCTSLDVQLLQLGPTDTATYQIKSKSAWATRPLPPPVHWKWKRIPPLTHPSGLFALATACPEMVMAPIGIPWAPLGLPSGLPWVLLGASEPPIGTAFRAPSVAHCRKDACNSSKAVNNNCCFIISAPLLDRSWTNFDPNQDGPLPNILIAHSCRKDACNSSRAIKSTPGPRKLTTYYLQHVP